MTLVCLINVLSQVPLFLSTRCYGRQNLLSMKPSIEAFSPNGILARMQVRSTSVRDAIRAFWVVSMETGIGSSGFVVIGARICGMILCGVNGFRWAAQRSERVHAALFSCCLVTPKEKERPHALGGTCEEGTMGAWVEEGTFPLVDLLPPRGWGMPFSDLSPHGWGLALTLTDLPLWVGGALTLTDLPPVGGGCPHPH